MDNILEIGFWLYASAIILAIPASLIWAWWKQRKDDDQ